MSDVILQFGILATYKIICILTGLAFGYMGYRLFLADKMANTGNITTNYKEFKISIKNAAPGALFSLFGAMLICFTIYKGLAFNNFYQNKPSQNIPSIVLPDKPPFK
jgi:hypothetical protein